MITTRVGRAAVLVASLAAASACVTSVDHTAATTPAAAPALAPARMPEPPAAGVVRKELDELTVAAPHAMTGYSRAKFPHWAAQGHECDTREIVLKRDGQNVVQDAACRAVSGTWHSPYDGTTLTSAAQVDVDHVVPLANAWRSGADTWDTANRKKFANDLVHSQLIAVSAASNRAKGDQSPDQWAPPNRAYWCTYARAWTHVKSLYKLSVTGPERAKLAGMLDTCS